MRLTPTILLRLALIALPAFGCGSTDRALSKARDAAVDLDLVALRAEIGEHNRKFTAAHVIGSLDSAAIVNMYTDDARILPPNADPVIGRPAIEALTSVYMAFGITEFREETTAFYGNQEMLVDEGTYFLAYDEGRQSETGKYLNIWRKERGEWKIHSNMWNTNAPHMDAGKLNEFATRYTAAWCSQDAARVASFFAGDGSLTINDGEPSVGRAAITAAAQGFMTAFPDMVVKMDSLGMDGGRITYHWTLTGTNRGPGGTGKAVRIQGHEDWRFGDDGLIAESRGHFDEAEYRRQLEAGFRGVR
jgi:uncharacterized protein (TIGR02246 family)